MAKEITFNHFIKTSMVNVSVYLKKQESEKTPIIFLHDLFFNHQLWNYQINAINDRDMIALDMPLHRNSLNITKTNWNLNDCSRMLLEILDSLQIAKVYAVGHSWGSMIILSAAEKNSKRFERLTLFNLFFNSLSEKEIKFIKVQHFGLILKNLYIKIASKTVFSSQIVSANPNLFSYINSCMKKLSNHSIKYLDKIVSIDAEDKTNSFDMISVKHSIIVGKEDKIAPTPPSENVINVTGRHSTPQELPASSLEIIQSDLK
jgi:hypothetical protein